MRHLGILAHSVEGAAMDSDRYPRALARYGIDALIPDDQDCRAVDDIIFGELVHGVFSDDSRLAYAQIIDRPRARGCYAVALACTEIPLLIDAESYPVSVLDSTWLLAAAAFSVAVEDSPMPSWRGGATR
jgi:aspartate racemase